MNEDEIPFTVTTPDLHTYIFTGHERRVLVACLGLMLRAVKVFGLGLSRNDIEVVEGLQARFEDGQ